MRNRNAPVNTIYTQFKGHSLRLLIEGVGAEDRPIDMAEVGLTQLAQGHLLPQHM